MHTPSVALLLVLTFAAAGCIDQFIDGDRPDPYDYVSSSDYERMVIEIDYVSGHEPPSQALSTLRQRVEACLDKPAGIQINVDDAIPPQGSPYSLDDIFRIRDTYRDVAHGDNNAASMWIVYLDGQYSGGAQTLGLATAGDTIAIFDDRVDDAANLLVSSTTIHRAVLVHEVGHLLGLVNNGIPMQTNHEDPEHRGHSDNRNSVMYWAVETSNIVTLVQNGGSIPLDFDADDRADLRAAGGTC
ncbi:MAG: hypothetical protein ACPGQL_08370 [Thermoplasmatota archaeon]